MLRKTKRNMEALAQEVARKKVDEMMYIEKTQAYENINRMEDRLRSSLLPIRAMHIVTQVAIDGATKEITIEEVLHAILDHCNITLGYKPIEAGKVTVTKSPKK